MSFTSTVACPPPHLNLIHSRHDDRPLHCWTHGTHMHWDCSRLLWGPFHQLPHQLMKRFPKALAWTVTGVAAALTVGRYIIRMKRLTGLHCDDGLHGLALMALIAYTAIFTASLPMVYALQSWVEGRGPAPSASTLKRYLRFALAASVVFWICIYSVKFAFLAFYRHLFGVSRGFMKAWWAVFAWTVLTFSVCAVSNAFLCVDSSGSFGTLTFHSLDPAHYSD